MVRSPRQQGDTVCGNVSPSTSIRDGVRSKRAMARLSLEYSNVSRFESAVAERSWALRSINVIPSRLGAGSIR